MDFFLQHGIDWIMAGAPWLFFHFKLADSPKM